MATLVIQPDSTVGKDTYADEANAATNFGNGTTFAIGYRTATTADCYAYLQFDLSSISSKSTITSAQLEIYAESTNEGETDNVEHKIYRVTESWTETGLTWNAKPADSSPSEVHSTLTINAGVTGFQTFTGLNTLVGYWVAGTVPNYGLVVRHVTDGAKPSMNYTSCEGTAAQRPKLTIVYTPYSNNQGVFVS